MKRILFILMLLALTVSQIFGAITYNSVSTTSGNSDTFTFNYTHTGSNGLLLVVVNLIPDAGQYVNYITYGNVTLQSSILVQTRLDSRAEVWYLTGTAEAENEIYVNISGPANTVVVAVSLSGVDQTNPFYFKTSVSGTQVSDLYALLQEETGNSILGMGCTNSDAETYALPGQTFLWNELYGTNELRTMAAYAESTNTGTVAIPNYLNKVCNWGAIFFNIKAATQ